MTTVVDSSVQVLPPQITASNTASTTASGSTLGGLGQDEAVTASYTEISKDKLDFGRSELEICKNCGKEINEPEMKNIPSNVAWLSFSFLFICCLWWISWVPFIVDHKRCNVCKTSVKVCPHCYRRIDRPPV